MKEILKNYKQPLLLLGGILLGGCLGFWAPQAVPFLRPVGEIFMNMLFVLIVPLVFFSVSSSVGNLTRGHLLGRMMRASILVWIVLMLVYGLVTYLLAVVYSPLESQLVSDNMLESHYHSGAHGFGNMLVEAVTVRDFKDLFSVSHILPLLIVSMLVGWGAAKVEGDGVQTFLAKGNELINKLMAGLMMLAPVGLGCYFAGAAADMGGVLLAGYGRVLIAYLIITLVFFFVVHPLLVLPILGKGSMRQYWQAMFAPSITAISSLSSSATMPLNIQAVKQLGVRDEVADSVIPMGTQLFKVGSVMSSAHKVIFVLLLSGADLLTPSSALMVIGLGILGSLVVGAVPTGAGTAEVLICSIMGVDPTMLGVLLLISTIEDMPGTLINVNGNSTATIIVERLTRARG